MMEKEQMIELTKRKISSRAGYGMFDGLDRLMKKEELLSMRPRMLRCHVALVLDMPVEAIPDGAFRAWLGRYRKATAPTIEKKQEKGTYTQKTGEGTDSKDDWLDFQPSRPVSLYTYDISKILRPVVDDPDE